ncbi:MAG: VOC family protein [Nakamurella sp.]
MNFVSIRVITDDVQRLAAFYATITGVEPVWGNPDFAELAMPHCTLAIASTRTMALFGRDAAHAADNHTVIIEFLVEDVDAEWERLTAHHLDIDLVNEPVTQPWGNRSLQFRDPDGNLINFFTPVTPEARTKFGL